MHLSTISVLLSVALAEAASFVTPIRHKTNKVSPNTPFFDTPKFRTFGSHTS